MRFALKITTGEIQQTERDKFYEKLKLMSHSRSGDDASATLVNRLTILKVNSLHFQN